MLQGRSPPFPCQWGVITELTSWGTEAEAIPKPIFAPLEQDWHSPVLEQLVIPLSPPAMPPQLPKPTAETGVEALDPLPDPLKPHQRRSRGRRWGSDGERLGIGTYRRHPGFQSRLPPAAG